MGPVDSAQVIQHYYDPIGHWIGGRFVEPASGRLTDVFNPATGQVARRVGMATQDEVNAAIAAAKAAAPGWADMPPVRRARVLNNFLALLNQYRNTLAAMITAEHGKVFSDAQGEVQRGLEVVEFACGLSHLLKGDISENVSTDVDSTGRCGSPWAWWPGSPRSTSPRWSRCGCTPWPSPAGTPSCSSPRSGTPR
jgi:delta 1-pyrroline-5-carboxylate dehydrogenase